MADAPLTYSIDACDEAFVRDFCPYKGSPDPLVVWRAAWKSALAATPSPPVAAPPATPGLIAAYAKGFYAAAGWAKRPDLYADIGSPAYVKEREQLLANLAAQPQPQPAQPLTDEQIKAAIHGAVKSGRLSWMGYEKDEVGEYTIPVLSPCHYQLARAIEATLTAPSTPTPPPREKS